ncbi:MAG: ABC transporter permease [Lachnospirales bacterium]
MFLAIKEMNYSKLRYTLVVGIILLISYAVFMLSGLANGLATEFKQAVVDWDSQTVILSEDSNKNLAASQLTEKNLEDVTSQKKAPLSIYNGAIDNSDSKIDIALFGTTANAFLLPNILEGEMFQNSREITISKNLANKGFKIGDTIKMGSDNIPMKVVGITPETFYTVAPVIYASLDDVAKIKYGKDFKANDDAQPINAIVTDTEKNTLDKEATPKLQALKTDEFINSLPGYAAQNLTLNSMIYFLFVIVT